MNKPGIPIPASVQSYWPDVLLRLLQLGYFQDFIIYDVVPASLLAQSHHLNQSHQAKYKTWQNDPMTLDCYRAGERVKKNTVGTERADQPAGWQRRCIYWKRSNCRTSLRVSEAKPCFPGFDRQHPLHFLVEKAKRSLKCEFVKSEKKS